MKATATPINQRIDLQLNVAFAFEALILNRLRRLPKTRSHEWLRSLLVEGFKRECRAIRKVQRAGDAGRDASLSQAATTHPEDLAAEHRGPIPRAKADPVPSSAAIVEQYRPAPVSFAALRKVVG